MELPPDITAGANQEGNEHAWPVSLFPAALEKAEGMRYACLGGQFQFRTDDGTCEMYWLSADSTERQRDEPWPVYCERSSAEVRQHFLRLVQETDFEKEAVAWPSVKKLILQGSDPLDLLVFVSYFVDEAEWSKLDDQLTWGQSP